MGEKRKQVDHQKQWAKNDSRQFTGKDLQIAQCYS